MVLIRVILSILLFFMSCYFIYDLIAVEYNYFILIAVFIGFLFSHFCWPTLKKGDYKYLDFLEIFIEIPAHLFIGLFRVLGAILKGIDF